MYKEYTIEAKFPENDIEYIEKKLKSVSFVNIKIKKKPEARTNQQNRALHLYYTKYSNALNKAGYDVRKTISQNVNLPWTPELVKEYIWRPLQEHKFKTRSTRGLKTNQIDDVVDLINISIGERTGVTISFPSMEEVLHNQEAKNL